MRRSSPLILLLFAWLVVLPCRGLGEDALGAHAIIARAHAAVGGEVWVRPSSLYLIGTSTFFNGDSEVHYDRHEMWRVYPKEKASAHEADGMVRIRSALKGKVGDVGEVALDIAFDGETTYVNGEASEEPARSRRWASNFGFGVIRHALDEGYSLTRLPDDSVDGQPSFMIQVRDPQGAETIFGIAKASHEILMAGFRTPRGWHQRIYSEFFSKQGSPWRQPGLVRLYYDGIKQNEVRWTDFEVNASIDPSVFRPSVPTVTHETH